MAAQMGTGWGMIMEEGGWRKGPWTAEEDRLLIEYVKVHGEGRWNSVARLTGLRRNGKSCRLRWVNYLRPDLKRGQITPHEESIILELHAKWGNRWSTIARSLPGRTDNEIKNYWRTHFKKKVTNSSGNQSVSKSKTRLLRKQQFQQQHYQRQQLQHQLEQQQQQQQQQRLECAQPQVSFTELKKILLLLEVEGDHKVTNSTPQTRQETATNMYAANNYTTQEQGLCYSMINSDNSTSSEVSNEDLLWDGLWTINDLQGYNNCSALCSTKSGLQGFASCC